MSRSQTPLPAPRREFIRDAARYTALAGLGALGAVLFARGGSMRGSACTGSGECGGCPLGRGCELPPARLARAQPIHVSP